VNGFIHPASDESKAVSGVLVDLELHQLIYSAIQNKRLIRFGYENKERIVEPHDYGIQKNIARLLSWQLGGQSSGHIPGWRWFDVAKMHDLEILDRSFAGNREASSKHHQWDEIFIRVAPPEDRKH
jgi:predicted DNA-binding transcriptional regulator YafY